MNKIPDELLFLLQQYAGRLHRSHHAKQEVVIYDYVDAKIPVALKMFERRKKGYTAMGYEIESGDNRGIVASEAPELPLNV